MPYLSSEYMFHLTKLSFFNIIYLWIKAIENTLTFHCNLLLSRDCYYSLLGNTSVQPRLIQKPVNSGGFSEQELVFIIQIMYY